MCRRVQGRFSPLRCVWNPCTALISEVRGPVSCHVCASLSHLCSSEESHFSCQSSKAMTVTWRTREKQEKMPVPWLTRASNLFFSMCVFVTIRNQRNAKDQGWRQNRGRCIMPRTFQRVAQIILITTKTGLHISLLTDVEVVVFTGKFSIGMSVEVQRAEEQKFFLSWLVFFFCFF